MIVGICSDKGSPGATALAVALGLVWPGEHLVMESDPSGGALSFRMRHAHTGELLEPEPTVASLGAVARLGLPPNGLMRFTQPTTLGVPVIPGPLTAERYAPLRSLWPQIATELRSWRGTVVADLGRMQPGHAGLPVAKAAAAVLLVGRADVEGLFGLRERAVELAHVLGDPDRARPSVALVVTGAPDTRREALRSAEAMLAAAGSPVPVAGFFAHDPAGARALWAGEVTRRLAGSELIRSARVIAETVMGWWPALAAPAEVPGTEDGLAVRQRATPDVPVAAVNPFIRLDGQAAAR